MNRFATVHDAKEYLVGRIAEEAQRDGMPLSETERKMLYFSATASADPELTEANEAFDHEYDQDKYEKKIARLIRSARKRARKEGTSESQAWSDAAGRLRSEDHYLSVMLGQARPPHDLLKLCGAALLMVCIGLLVFYLAAHLDGLLPSGKTRRENSGFLFWVVWTAAVCASLVSMLLGRERTEWVLDKTLGRFLRIFRK